MLVSICRGFVILVLQSATASIALYLGVNVKNKKFLILLAIAIAFVSVVVAFAVVFSVGEANPYFRTFEGDACAPTETAPSANDILKFCKGQNIFLLNKDTLLTELNKSNREWYAFRVVVSFPNVVNVHFIQNQVVAKVKVNGTLVTLDSFGCIVGTGQENDGYLDISAAFKSEPLTAEVGSPLQYTMQSDNTRLKVILDALMSVWQCNVEFDDIGTVMGSEGVFNFDAEENLLITMPSGARILVKAPEYNLSDRIIDALSVYYSNNDLQKTGVIITVYKNGTIATA